MTPTPPRLGRYVLISEVARGGFGRLSTACTRLDSGEAQTVLIRRLQKGSSLEPKALEQIEHAARRSMTVYGEHIANAIAIEDTDDELAIVFDYAEGKDLRSLLAVASLKHQRIPAGVALHIVLSALEGLKELRGDFPEELSTAALWPDSVFIATDGRVKLLDAPIAAVLTRTPGPREFRQLIGYCAPEEFDAAAELGQSDVFRAGVLLWEMIAAKRLFSSGTVNHNIEQIRHAPIPPFEELALEHAPLAEIVLRALERDPGARYASTDDLHAALETCGVPRASSTQVSAYVTELVGSGIALQQRAVAAALERLAKLEDKPAAVPFVMPARRERHTLLGVPAPAVLPARPAPRVPPPPPPPPPRAGRPAVGSSPLILPSVDDLESELGSHPAPASARIPDELPIEMDLLEEVNDDDGEVALPIGPLPPIAPLPPLSPPRVAVTQELESETEPEPSRKLGLARKHLVAGAAALAILLLGAGVLALVGMARSSPETADSVSPSSEPLRASMTAAPIQPKAAPPKAIEKPAPEPQEPSSETPDSTEDALTAAPNSAEKKPPPAKKPKDKYAAARQAQAEKIAKINKANKKRAAAKKKQAAAAKKKSKTKAKTSKKKPKKKSKKKSTFVKR